MNEDELSNQITGAAIEVHKAMGPGLLEAVYEDCLAFELDERHIPNARQKQIPLAYKGHELGSELRIDFLVGGLVVVELKSVETILPVHEAQVITYLKLTGCKLGLLLNFNVGRLKTGIRRFVLNL